MSTYRYMRIALKYIIQEVIDEYNLTSMVHSGYMYTEIRKGMYGSKEAGIIAYKNLVQKLKPHGYYPVAYTPGIWKHTSLTTIFTLAVDNFGIKFFHKTDAQHLFDALQQSYHIKIDWSGNHYCGLTITWQYAQGYMDISMSGYASKALQKFLHLALKCPQHAPHQ